MKLIAKENIKVATDGIGWQVVTAQAGEVFDIEGRIGELLIQNGQAEAVEQVEEKQIEAAPENKMVKKAPLKKGKK